MAAFCRQNPTNNPYWCNLIQGYCQFQVQGYINEMCPIYHGYPKWPIHVDDDDIDDDFLQTYGYATIYDNHNRLVSLGDTAFQQYNRTGGFVLEVPYVRYIGKYAFQDCTSLQTLDFSGYSDPDGFIPVLASPQAFMTSDGTRFVNDDFQILVPQSLYERWRTAPNWAALDKHIHGV